MLDAFVVDVEDGLAKMRAQLEKAAEPAVAVGQRRPRHRPLGEEALWDAAMLEWTFGLPCSTAPKVLSDVIESLVGAVWVDSGADLAAAWAVARRLLAPLQVPTPGGAPLPHHPKRILYVSFSLAGCGPWHFVSISPTFC